MNIENYFQTWTNNLEPGAKLIQKNKKIKNKKKKLKKKIIKKKTSRWRSTHIIDIYIKHIYNAYLPSNNNGTKSNVTIHEFINPYFPNLFFLYSLKISEN